MIKINNTDISDIKINNESISKVYLGSDEVWQIGLQNYQLFDILYSDANGNLSVSNQVLPVSEGKTPIALCIAGTNFFGEGEKARWISLKYMSYSAPSTGSLSTVHLAYGNYDYDIPTIDNINLTHLGGKAWGHITADWVTATNMKIPSLFDNDGNWNISVLGTVNQYSMTDIDGKNKTKKLLDTVTNLPTWETDSSIINNIDQGYAPSACCCARYYTPGTLAGDWYLGSIGEICMIATLRDTINNKLSQIATIYPNDSINSLSAEEYWSSTEESNYYAQSVSLNDGTVHGNNKYNKNPRTVLAMLQY